VGAKSSVLIPSVRKPDKLWWVQVHPDESYSQQLALVEDRSQISDNLYIVHPDLQDVVEAADLHFGVRLLCLAITRQGTLFFWEVKLPRLGMPINKWSASALSAIEQARKGWVRVTPFTQASQYRIWQPPGKFPAPEWPGQLPSMRDLLELTFKGQVIDTPDHPLLQQARGEN
jgi:hypothetical protein